MKRRGSGFEGGGTATRRDMVRLRRLIEVQTELGGPELGEARIIELAAEFAVELTGGPGAAVQMLDGDEVVIAAAVGFGDQLRGMRFPTKGNPIRGCIAGGGAESTQDALVDPRCNQEVARITGIRSLIMAPLRHEGAVIGGLQLQSPDAGGFPDGTQTTLELLAGFAAAAHSRARAASAMRASEQLLSGAFQASGVGMALTGLDGSVLRANPSLCEMLGYCEGELIGMNARGLLAPEDLDHAFGTLAGLYRRSDPAVTTTDLRVIDKAGRAIWTRLTASLVQLDGEPRHVLLHLVDVTEERKAAAILRTEQERLGVIIEAQREIAGNEPDIDRLLRVLTEHTITLTGAGAAVVLLPKDDRLVVRAGAGSPQIPIGFSVPVDGSAAGLAYRSREVQRLSDARTDPRSHRATAQQMGLGAMVATPLISGDNVIGVLMLISTGSGELDETDVRTVQMVAGFAAAAFERAAAAQRLVLSEKRTRAVIESAPEAIVTIDSRGAIAAFNPAAERAFLRPRGEVIGESALILLAPKHSQAFGRWIRDAKKAGSAEYAGQHFEATARRADGSEFPMEVAIANMPEEMQMAAAFLRDLSMRDRLNESRERLAAVVSNAPVILMACDAAGTVTLAEGKGLAALGLDPGKLVGRAVSELVSSQSDYLEYLERALQGETVSGQFHLRSPDRFLEGKLSPIHDSEGAVIGASTVLTDVTDRVRADAALRESEAKSRLMAMMNHEVRTPLNSILGFAHLLTDPKFGPLTSQQRRHVDHIHASADHLLTLVNDSLDLAKLDAGRAGIQMVDIPVHVPTEQAVDQVRPLAEARGLTLHVADMDALAVRGDPRQIVQVLLNLLSNAIRHTQSGTVTVSARRDGDRVAIRVADTGDGIAREDLGRIFEEFYQAGNHAPGGIGLGLAISRRLVQLMGGTIEVESTLGRGSTFTVYLPATTGPTPG